MYGKRAFGVRKSKTWAEAMGVWHGVAMNSIKFHPGPPFLALPCPAGGPPLKRTHTGRTACGCLLPFQTPHAVRLWGGGGSE
jgi:hypothetical protein